MLNEKSRKGFLFVISSPSGGGKSTIYSALLALGNPFEFSISATTRPPRKGEIDGVHYHFITEERFTEMVEHGDFAEWANVHGHRYGTPREFVDRAFAEGKIMILEIDVQGAFQLKKNYPDDAVLVFVAPPSRIETERRLRTRAVNTEDDIALRLDNAAEEIKHAKAFDYIVFNYKIEDAITDVVAIATAEFASAKRFIGEIWDSEQ